MFRFYNRLQPPSMKNIFKLWAENPYNLRYVTEFSILMIKSIISELKVYHI